MTGVLAVVAAILIASLVFHELERLAAHRAARAADRAATRRRHPTSHVTMLDTDPHLEP